MGFWDGFFRAAKQEGLITAEDLAPAPSTVSENPAPASADQTAAMQVQAEQVAAIAKLQADLSTLQQEKQRLTSEARDKRLSDLIAGLPGGAAWVGAAATHQTVLTMLADRFGEESTEFAAYVELQRGSAAQLAASDLLKEHGSDVPATATGSAWSRIESRAKQLAADEGLTYAAAVARIAQQDPDLYAQYEAEQRAR